MTPNQPDSGMTAPSFLVPNQHNQQTVPSGNHAIMSMMNTRQHSRITANLYSNQSNTMNNQNAAMAPPAMALMPPQQQLTNNGSYVMNSNFVVGNMNSNVVNMNSNAASNVTALNNAVSNGNMMNAVVSQNTAVQNNVTSSDDAPQQVQIAGLNGITFTLPQSHNTSTAPVNGGLDALTLSTLNGTVPEFLFQLTKMLTDECNKEVIVWNTGVTFGNHKIGGRIEVHSPKRMEEEVLGKYFRHSKYSSFQRQLNYFGFRKIAGKGKMSPCSYVNDMATSDIRSLLLIKRKGHKSADEESVVSDSKTSASDQKTSKTPERAGGKRRSSMPETKSAVNFNQPIAVMAVGSAPSMGNMQAIQALSENAKKAKLSSSTDNHYINVTDNGSYGIVANTNSAGGQVSAQNPSDGLLQSYNMAIGQGIKHQLTNLVAQNSGGTVVTSNTSFAPSSHNSYSTIATSSAFSTSSAPFSNNNANFNPYLAHTSGRQALTASAPMQFLDPNELGMSIENSLNELKNNFKAANNVSNTPSSTAQTLPQYSHTPACNEVTENSVVMPPSVHNDSTSVRAAAPTLTTADECYIPTSAIDGPKAKVPAHLLSRDDSLIDLAMLPTTDSGSDLTSFNSPFFNTYISSDNNGGFLHRDDSLIELAAAVDQANNANSADNATAPNDSQYGNNDDNSADAFSFFDM